MRMLLVFCGFLTLWGCGEDEIKVQKHLVARPMREGVFIFDNVGTFKTSEANLTLYFSADGKCERHSISFSSPRTGDKFALRQRGGCVIEGRHVLERGDTQINIFMDDISHLFVDGSHAMVVEDGMAYFEGSAENSTYGTITYSGEVPLLFGCAYEDKDWQINNRRESCVDLLSELNKK